jgi:diacylglycerol kinase (ATP)
VPFAAIRGGRVISIAETPLGETGCITLPIPIFGPARSRRRAVESYRFATRAASLRYNASQNRVYYRRVIVARPWPEDSPMPAAVSTTRIAREADRVAILINPKAGPSAAQPRAQRLAESLNGEGFRPELFTDLAAAASTANRWHAEGRLRALVAAGGDGTAAELVNRTDPGVPITLLPSGNSNLVAGYFHLSRDPETLCRTIVEGRAARIDAGEANGRIFLVVASCGFDAEVVRRVHGRRTGHVSHLSYLKPIAEAIGSYRFPEIRVHWEQDDASSGDLSARWLFMFNLPCYGGGFQIAPHADGADGLLDLYSLRRGHLWPGLGYVAAILTGWHQRLADWTTRRVGRVRLTSDGPVPYELDGDPGGVLPLDIRVLPGRLTLVVPAEVVDSG